MFDIMSRIFVFLKNWLLPAAMITGTALYLLLSRISVFAPIRPALLRIVNISLPVIIFAMLFFTFCKIDFKELKPRKWHFILLVMQSCLCVGCMLLIMLLFNGNDFSEHLLEGVLACLLSPTAAAAAVITGKLGGSIASLTSYTLESNILSALLITLLCPLIHPVEGLHLFVAFVAVLYKISLLLILPFVLAVIVRYTAPELHVRIAALKDISFYLWGCTLTLVTGLTMRVVFANATDYILEISLVIGAAVVCVFKFALGKFVGGLYGREERISAGQAFGQKNTSFTIWMALTFLTPIAAVAPGSYVIWQNIINSYQLWKKRRKTISDK